MRESSKARGYNQSLVYLFRYFRHLSNFTFKSTNNIVGFWSDSLKVGCLFESSQIICALLLRMKHPGAAFSSSLQYSQINSILQYSKFIAIFTPHTASLVRPAPHVWVECRKGKTQHFWKEEQQVGRGTLGGRRFVLIGCLQFLNFSRKYFTYHFTILHLCGEKEVGKQMPGSSP